MEAKKIQFNRLKAQRLLGEVMDNYWKELKQGREVGKLVVWSTNTAPTELLSPRDFVVFYPEQYATVCGTAGVSTELCQQAEARDWTPDTCGYPRTSLGYSLVGEKENLPVKGIPRPDLLFISNAPCNIIAYWFDALSHFYHVPLLMTDVPFYHDDFDANREQRARAVNYIQSQLGEHIGFLEKLTGRRYDYDYFVERIEHSGRAGRLWMEIHDFPRHIPSPLNYVDLSANIFCVMCLRGYPQAAAYYEQLKAELTERVANKIPSLPNEKYRLYAHSIPPWYALPGFMRKFALYDAVPVISLYGYVWRRDVLDSSRPLESLAEALFVNEGDRGTRYKASKALKCIQYYSLDGIVHTLNRGCKPIFPSQYTEVEIMERESGVPAMVVEYDQVDARTWSEAEVDAKIQAFMEIVANRAQERRG